MRCAARNVELNESDTATMCSRCVLLTPPGATVPVTHACNTIQEFGDVHLRCAGRLRESGWPTRGRGQTMSDERSMTMRQLELDNNWLRDVLSALPRGHDARHGAERDCDSLPRRPLRHLLDSELSGALASCPTPVTPPSTRLRDELRRVERLNHEKQRRSPATCSLTQYWLNAACDLPSATHHDDCTRDS